MLRKADRLRTKLGGEAGLGLTPERPGWMGERAYRRAMGRIRELDDEYARGAIAQLGGREAFEELQRRIRGEED